MNGKGSLVSVPAAVCCVVLLMAPLPSAAYVIGDDAIIAEVPFEFTCDDQSFAPGTYLVVHRVNPFPSLRLESSDGKAGLLLLATVRIGRPPGLSPPRASLVFDKVGENHFLTEVWLPGRDGYRIRSTKQEHERVVVDAKK
jgi:hypothetical protein